MIYVTSAKVNLSCSTYFIYCNWLVGSMEGCRSPITSQRFAETLTAIEKKWLTAAWVVIGLIL